MNLTQDELRLIREALELKMNAWLVSHKGEFADLSKEFMLIHTLYHKTYAESELLTHLEVEA